jgi:transcriptional regulator with XRE-family HTH domain
MYYFLHKEDVSKFYEAANEIYINARPQTNLNHIRKTTGLSQAKLASEAGVPLRLIQMYEQREKDINKAQVHNVIKLARALGCNVEELME